MISFIDRLHVAYTPVHMECLLFFMTFLLSFIQSHPFSPLYLAYMYCPAKDNIEPTTQIPENKYIIYLVIYKKNEVG